MSGGSITHVGIALTFGLVILAMIYAVGEISGAHFNPAVTSAFWLSGRFPAGLVLPYIASQCLGAFAASGVLRLPVSGSRHARKHLASRGRNAVIRLGTDFDVLFDVRDF